jgi:hypothetical protein
MFKESHINQRLRNLKKRLKEENPVLSKVVDSFRELDQISRRLGYFNKEESHATRTSWWPLISILGCYSAGKSTFINYYLRHKLQATGNQAVDDKFSVICFTNDDKVRVLPGLALDADPRFPFYKISQAIEEVAEGEGQRVDAYLQLKTCPSELLRGKILIDSPGFDADAQRTSTLRITDHIIDLSDLVLVFFDARHPESGSMRDTLKHLVGKTLSRRDSNKFLYILNQIDNTAFEDNIEEVFASWQRALAQIGLTAGSCYAIYIPDVAVPIEDDHIRERFEAKRDAYLSEIFERIERVGEERAYRIVGMLEETAQMLEQEAVPLIRQFLLSWRRKTLWTDGFIFVSILIIFLAVTIWGEYWDGFSLDLPLLDNLPGGKYTLYGILGVLVLGAAYIHVSVRQWASKSLISKFLKKIDDPDSILNYARAFGKNSAWHQSIFRRQPIGWSRRTKQRLAKILDNSNAYIQKLNDMYTNPSGDKTYLPVMGSKSVDDTIQTETPAESSGASEEKNQVN